ncbi:hypothetical protein PAXRUDRAFT_19605 [Paxillus rubicundulus Ve08.2h10]|uniref:Uncharacterized protein n=1 Tax=Paxillus rubicundulus Ve08.2h10 TaxID=930991 RepID=A0A0D0BTG0_9AGAM|nr:hypothetical protein PAXRUDRAFT_19605 [Paxillus rubicundulus Ve08.2h10]
MDGLVKSVNGLKNSHRTHESESLARGITLGRRHPHRHSRTDSLSYTDSEGHRSPTVTTYET